jgi:chorismate synthase
VSGNSIGKEFVVTCFGESHGKCVGVIVDGCPSGLRICERDIQVELDRRIPSNSKVVSERKEEDTIHVMSGLFEGFTTGAPLCALVGNRTANPSDYDRLRFLPRPGHSDYTAWVKHGGFNDYRGGGRFSGRATVSLVIAGAVAKRLLGLLGIKVVAYTIAVRNVKIDKTPSVEEILSRKFQNALRCPDFQAAKRMEDAVLRAKREGDSLGGVVECISVNVPAGLGEPFFDSLDADIAKMLFSVPAVKGVEFGAGFPSSEMKGSENNDEYLLRMGRIITKTNNAGGVLGGISSGMPIVVRAAIKPTSSIQKRQKSVDLLKMKETTIQVTGRHDACIVPKAVPVIESGVAIVLADHMIRAGKIPRVLREERLNGRNRERKKRA